MGQAREVVDRSIAEVHAHLPGQQLAKIKDLGSVAEVYATDAVAVTPDQGEITGRESIVEWYRQALEAFPDQEYEFLRKHESGNAAITEGYITGTNTVPLRLPSGESVPATGEKSEFEPVVLQSSKAV